MMMMLMRIKKALRTGSEMTKKNEKEKKMKKSRKKSQEIWKDMNERKFLNEILS